MSFVRFTAREDAATLCECLREALVYFGGTPEHVLFDNAKSVVIECDAFGGGEHRWNPQLCWPYRDRTRIDAPPAFPYLTFSPVHIPMPGMEESARAANVGPNRQKGGSVHFHQQLIDAIKHTSVIEVQYDGLTQLVEPHVYGIDDEFRYVLLCYQTAGDDEPVSSFGWKTVRMDHVTAQRETGVSFRSARPGYVSNDPALLHVYAQL